LYDGRFVVEDDRTTMINFRGSVAAKEMVAGLAAEAGKSDSELMRLFLSMGMQAYRAGIKSSDELRAALAAA
jgi:hypothetical protein